MLYGKVTVYFSSKFCFSNTIAIFFVACYVSFCHLSVCQYHVLNTMYFSSSLKFLVSEHLVASSYPSSCHHVLLLDNVLLCTDWLLDPLLVVVLFILTSLSYMVSYMVNIRVVLMRWIYVVNWTELNILMIRVAAYIHLKQQKATWDFPPQLHPALIGYRVRLKLCEPKLWPWVDVLMHIHVAVGKSVNVKAVSRAD